MLFGRKSEKLLRQIEQLELELEEAYISEGERQEKREAQPAANPAVRPPRQPLPEHLPREAKEHLPDDRSEEHTSELQSLMRISYAVFCLKKNKQKET